MLFDRRFGELDLIKKLLQQQPQLPLMRELYPAIRPPYLKSLNKIQLQKENCRAGPSPISTI